MLMESAKIRDILFSLRTLEYHPLSWHPNTSEYVLSFGKGQGLQCDKFVSRGKGQ